MRHTFTLGIAVLALSIFPACVKSTPDAQDARERAQADRTQSDATAEAVRKQEAFIQTREMYRSRMQQRLDTINRDIDAIRAIAANLSGQRRADLDARLLDLQAKRERAQRELAATSAVTAAEFEPLKASLDALFDALQKSVQDSRSSN